MVFVSSKSVKAIKSYGHLNIGILVQFLEERHCINVLEVTIARKVLPHPQGIKGSMQNLLN
jgi:hypothetical protein